MSAYQEKTNSVVVPKNTGVEGFIKTLRGILSLPRVQSINIDAKGKVQYTRYVREGETDSPLGVDYTNIEPWSIIRNGHLDELNYRNGEPATNVIAAMFDKVACEGLTPIAFATGADTDLWSWHQRTAGVTLTKTNSIYGLPVYMDRQMPDYSLVLCAAYVKGGLSDCHRFISTSMGADPGVPETTVSIL